MKKKKNTWKNTWKKYVHCNGQGEGKKNVLI